MPNAEKLRVADGVSPATLVVFDVSSGVPVLRPAKENEHSTDQRPVYRFEWVEDGAVMMYEVAPPSTVKDLDDLNAKTVSTAETKAYEKSAIGVFVDGGKTLGRCFAKGPKFRGVLVMYFTIEEDGSQGPIVIQPEGSIAQCIIEEAQSRTYPKPPMRFVAKATVRVSE
jgi:hypothetical protein